MEWLYNNGIGSIVISSGEFNNEGRTEFIEGICQNTTEKSKTLDKKLRVLYQYTNQSRKVKVIILKEFQFKLVFKWVKFL